MLSPLPPPPPVIESISFVVCFDFVGSLLFNIVYGFGFCQSVGGVWVWTIDLGSCFIYSVRSFRTIGWFLYPTSTQWYVLTDLTHRLLLGVTRSATPINRCGKRERGKAADSSLKRRSLSIVCPFGSANRREFFPSRHCYGLTIHGKKEKRKKK